MYDLEWWRDKQIKLLGNGYVELIDVMGSDMSIITTSRGTSMGESLGIDKDKEYLSTLFDKNDYSFRMVVLKFRIKAPILVWFKLLGYDWDFVFGYWDLFDILLLVFGILLV